MGVRGQAVVGMLSDADIGNLFDHSHVTGRVSNLLQEVRLDAI